ncbi:MAG: hydantoinase/oxoprolinase family protein, partial [Holophagales bacterium]|nr:hydantoinase/oxoprolinase family protein [Holophagales bacterium]
GEVWSPRPAGRRDAALSFAYRAPWTLVDGFADGAQLRWLDRPGRPASRVSATRVSATGAAAPGAPAHRVPAGSGRITLESPPAAAPSGDPRPPTPGERFELRFREEAPVLAARLITGSAAARDLPPMELRLATTRGTNALLERRGAKVLLLITEGFADLLRIGDQRRPDLFALEIETRDPLYARVVEVRERLAADGSVVRPLDLESLAPELDRALAEGFESAAVALMHSYAHPSHERAVAAELGRRGFDEVSISSELSPTLGFTARTETAVVDAYLSPVIRRYLARVRASVESAAEREGGRPHRLHVMTSAGGLISAARYRAKDSLLSGPAGGVVGAAESGRRLGFRQLVAFDMGGTSTDVSRFDGDFEYRYQQRVAGARVSAPMLAIETVAAGGGSICWLDGPQLKVGPESAGADPGPACYGAGGPLTLTDINLLLGRLRAERFGIPVRPEAAKAAADALLAELAGRGSKLGREVLLAGFLAIADQRMADAVRRISVRQGYDPRIYALVAFGGAGGQHACSVARLLGMETVLLPREAGLLSALGLGAAVHERIAVEPVLEPLPQVAGELDRRLRALVRSARAELEAEGVDRREIVVRRRSAFVRLEGQESTLEVRLPGGADPLAQELAEGFGRRYLERYGFAPAARQLELESLRVTVSARPASPGVTARETGRQAPGVAAERAEAWIGGRSRSVEVRDLHTLGEGERLRGPALVFDAHASLTLEQDWTAEARPEGLICRWQPGSPDPAGAPPDRVRRDPRLLDGPG